MKYNYVTPDSFVTLDRYSKENNIIFSKRSIPVSHVVPTHWHEFFELEFIISGSAKHYINNLESELTVGSAYIISHCDFHSICPHEDVLLYNLSFMPLWLDSKICNALCNTAGGICYNFESDDLELIKQLFERALTYSDSSSKYRDVMLLSIAEQIAVLLLEKANINPNPDKDDFSVIAKTIAIINADFNSQITLKTVAQKLHISPNYLGNLFKLQVGETFNKYLNSVRLKYACSQLKNTNKYIKEIAFESGFDSPEYFISVFKNCMGATPSVYRNLNLSDKISL